jgi:hypothetical protein
MSAADVDELRRAARWVVERHAEEAVLHYASPSGASAPSFLRVVANGGGADDGRAER